MLGAAEEGSCSSCMDPRGESSGSHKACTKRRAAGALVNEKLLADCAWGLPGEGREQRLGDSELSIGAVR